MNKVEDISPLVRLLAQSFSNHSTKTALENGKTAWSYQQLADFQERAVRDFQKAGLTPRSVIGLLLPKQLETVGLIAAALYTDLIYLPLAIDNPADRLAYIVSDAGCDAVITTEAYAEVLPNYSFEVFMDGLLIGQPSARPSDKDFPADIAYLLYTSGSTGRPKGVMITHANARCFVDWAAAYFELSAADKIAAIAPFHFDLSVFDLFATLKTGATLSLFTAADARNPRLLAQQLAGREISVIYTTPSLLQLLLRHGKMERYDYSKLRLLLFAGEVFPIDALRALKSRWPWVVMHNLYGPTETNVVTSHPIPIAIPREVDTPYPIGSLCPYTQALLRNETILSACLPGQEGELLIAGSSVSPGYVKSGTSSVDHFIVHAGQTWYPTGDWVAIAESGGIVYRGRTDRMVKRRGYRIELAEVEQSVLTHSDISAAAAVFTENKDDKHIDIWYATENEQPLSHPVLKAYLAEQLPLYMSPDRFFHTADFPLTSSGKINFRTLKNWSENVK